MTNRGNNLDMIDRSFFDDKIFVDTSKVFPVVVMATMSCGKSTLINALLDMDILPNKNEACTAKVYSILDDDSAEKYKLYITYKNGTITSIEDNLHDNLEKANDDSDVKDILIVGDIKGVLNTDKSLLVIDTPGPNNSSDQSHAHITSEVLNKVNSGLILYVINATQMGINDDKYLLEMLRDFLRKHEGFNVLFVVNKVDELDYERESLADLMRQTKEYIESNGIKADNMVPISALAANLIKKVLSGRNMTRKEISTFYNCYDLYKTSDLRMTSYAITDDLPDQYKEITLKGKSYTIADLKAALENTGVLYLEKHIQKAQILSSGHDLKIHMVETDKRSMEYTHTQYAGNKSYNKTNKAINNSHLTIRQALSQNPPRELPHFSIEYNKYFMCYDFKKNGIPIDHNSEIGIISRDLPMPDKYFSGTLSEVTQNTSSKRLFDSWTRLIEKISDIFSDDSFVLSYKGFQNDFNDLKYCVDHYFGDKMIYLVFESI